MTENKTPAKKAEKSSEPKPGSKYVVGADGSLPVDRSGLGSVPGEVLNPAFYLNEDDYAELADKSDES